jgi:Mg2+ and Co2+ transporter CorA
MGVHSMNYRSWIDDVEQDIQQVNSIITRKSQKRRSGGDMTVSKVLSLRTELQTWREIRRELWNMKRSLEKLAKETSHA